MRQLSGVDASFLAMEGVARGDESTRELLGRFGAAPKVPFNAAIGPHRRWAYVSVPLDDAKVVKNAAGTTVNDVILAVVSGVLRNWLESNGGIPDLWSMADAVPLALGDLAAAVSD